MTRRIVTTLLCAATLLLVCAGGNALAKSRTLPSTQGGTPKASAGRSQEPVLKSRPNQTAQAVDTRHGTTVVPLGSTKQVELPPLSTPTPQRSATSSASSYEIHWQSINTGGAPAAGANYAVNSSVGQSAIGSASSGGYAVAAGYWYGSGVTNSGCSCPYQCDFNEDEFLDANDLNALIDALFFGGANPTDPDCPVTRGDFDNSGFPDAVDLNGLIDHLFFGGTPPVDPCSP